METESADTRPSFENRDEGTSKESEPNRSNYPFVVNTDNLNSSNTSETPQLETTPVDFRFPTTNQSRHCFTRYIEHHRCVAAKGEGASKCEKFARYYRSLCPGEWVDRWNEQRENGTFPGPF
ncbi:cytochrome c oxidase subunit 6b-3-like [Papaver somniferum]|uniref:cytochrome c oxidase subunit 6b-3-like n=1 Tax=Papaver somniferum TaxID=3469 RepID=UPI000E6FD119|nr:cytochrome c oxidase subunit 6b-3-like [Papaver somniferum]